MSDMTYHTHSENGMMTTSIRTTVGDDATEFYIGFYIYKNQPYNSLKIFEILKELTKQSLQHINKNTGNKYENEYNNEYGYDYGNEYGYDYGNKNINEKIHLKSNLAGTKFELTAWTQGNASINFQKIQENYTDAFIVIHKILEDKE